MINKITDFLWDSCVYMHSDSKEKLAEAIKKHVEFKTIVCLQDELGIVGVCRFNIDGKEAYILDVAVRKDLRKKDVLTELLKIGLGMYPNVKQLRFNAVALGKEFVAPVSLILNTCKKRG